MNRLSIFLFAAILVLCSFAHGQGSAAAGPPVAVNQNGVPLASTLVTVCNSNPGAGVCPSLVPLYTDITLAHQCSGSAASLNNISNPTVTSGCSNPGYTDSLGNVVAFTGTGAYFCQYSSASIATYSQPCPFPGAGAAPDRPLWGTTYGINGVNSYTTMPPVKIGAAGATTPDFITAWDVWTAPSLFFNLTASPGTITIASTSSPTVTCNTCPTLTSVATADGVQLSTVPSGQAFLVFYSTTANQQARYILPIASVGASTITLASNAPVTVTTLNYQIFWRERLGLFRDAIAANGGDILFVYGPTPSQFSTNVSTTACHKQSLNGAGSCDPPSDLTSGGQCSNVAYGGGLLVGSNDCRTKELVDIILAAMMQRGTPIKYLEVGNESNKCATDNSANCDANAVVGTDGEWDDTIAHLAIFAADVCDQAHATFPAIRCSGPGFESLATKNGFGINTGCGQTSAVKGAEYANTFYGTAGIASHLDAIAFHGYVGYVPQVQDYVLSTLLRSCANLNAAASLLPLWNTEYVEGYSSLSSSSMVQASAISCSAGTCTATLGQQVTAWDTAGFQQQNWLVGDSIVITGSTGGDTAIAGVPITAVNHSPDTVSWAGSGVTAGSSTYLFDVTLNYGFSAESFLLQYFRKRVHQPGAIDLMQWAYWINNNSSAQGFPLCIGARYTAAACSLLSLEGIAMGEALNWVRLGNGVIPDTSPQCLPAAVSATFNACPFKGIYIATGHEALGALVEVAFYADPVLHGTASLAAPAWANHYLTVSGTSIAVAGGASVTLTHAQPILFTSN